MAIVKYGPIVANASGTVGGTTFTSGTKNGPTARNRLRRSQNTNQQADQARALWASARRLWRSLTPEQRKAWSFAALTYPHTNRLGVATRLSGHMLFMKLNTDGGPIFFSQFQTRPFTDPPILTKPEPLPIFDVSFSLADGYFFSFVDRLTTGLDIAVISGFRTFSTTPTAKPKYMRAFFTVTTFTVPPIPFKSFWDGRIGEPQVGEHVWLGARWSILRSPLEEIQLIQSVVTA